MNAHKIIMHIRQSLKSGPFSSSSSSSLGVRLGDDVIMLKYSGRPQISQNVPIVQNSLKNTPTKNMKHVNNLGKLII